MTRLPHTPPKPGIGKKRRRQLAVAWLRRLDLDIDPGRVEALAPVVGRFRRGTVLGDIADAVVLDGGVPYREVVEERFLAMPGPPSRPSRFPDALDDPQAQEVARWVHEYRVEHGVGPRWKDVSATFGWDTVTMHRVLNDLRARGYLAYTMEARSLTARPGGDLYAAPCPPPRRPPRPAAQSYPEQAAEPADPALELRRALTREHREEYLQLLHAELSRAGLPSTPPHRTPSRQESWSYALAHGAVHDSPAAQRLLAASEEAFTTVVEDDLNNRELVPGLREPGVVNRWRKTLADVENRARQDKPSPYRESLLTQIRARRSEAKTASRRAHQQAVAAIDSLNREPERAAIKARVQDRLLAAYAPSEIAGESRSP